MIVTTLWAISHLISALSEVSKWKVMGLEFLKSIASLVSGALVYWLKGVLFSQQGCRLQIRGNFYASSMGFAFHSIPKRLVAGVQDLREFTVSR
jgi:hypothetical protein